MQLSLLVVLLLVLGACAGADPRADNAKAVAERGDHTGGASETVGNAQPKLEAMNQAKNEVPAVPGTTSGGTASSEHEAKTAHEKGDYTRAAALTRPFADQGQAWAQFNLAAMLEEGKGVPKDEKQAEDLYRKAAAQGDKRAQVKLESMNRAKHQAQQDEAKAAYEKGDYARAAALVRPLAEQGLAWAQFTLGVMHQYGKGAPRDEKQAGVSYRKAAEQGYADAQYKLGVWELNGRHKEAAKNWFLKAAAQGHAPSMVQLGAMVERMIESGYTDGDLILPTEKGGWRTPTCDDVVNWYLTAAKQNYTPGMVRLGKLFAVGRCLPVDGKEAEAWYRKAAEQGDVNGMIQLAEMYEEGKLVLKNSKEALRWSHKAGEQGDVGTQKKLGTRYLNGDGVPKNPKEGVRWLQKAAEQGDLWAINQLGLMYQNGKDVRKDITEARKWYRMGAAQEDVGSMARLAESYRLKKSEQDLVHVYMWYSLAAMLADEAKKMRDQLERQMTAAQIKKAQELAERCQSSNYKECE